MKHLQTKYNLLQIFYWMAECAIYRFTAIFLVSKGLTNTGIGIASGGACVLSIVLGPMLSSLSAKYNRISLQQYLAAGMLFSILCYLGAAFLELPGPVLTGIFMIGCCVVMSLNSFLSQISMEYIEDGEKLSFGTARGLGSVAHAISAVALTQLIAFFTPNFLSLMFGVTSAGFIAVLLTTRPVYAKSSSGDRKSGTLYGCIQRYPVYFLILVGFGLAYAAGSALSTYLINIISMHHVDTSLYGIAVFCSAASELPFMAASARLMKRYVSLKLIAAAGFFYILRNCLIALSPNIGILLLGMAFQGASFGVMTPVITMYVSQNLKRADQVMGQAMICLMTKGAGATMANIAGGWLIDSMGMGIFFSGCIGVTLIGSAIMICIGCTGYRTEKSGAI